MQRPLKVLIVEDNPSDAELLIMELEDHDFEVTSERVDTAQAYWAALEKEEWDIIFSDHSMPHFSSFQALKLRNEKDLDIPFIILSGTIGEDLAVDAMKAGANISLRASSLASLRQSTGSCKKRKIERCVEKPSRNWNILFHP